IDRSGIALVGAAAMLVAGALSLHAAAVAVDYQTLILLFGMMVVVVHLRLAGFFALVTDDIAARFSGPFALLAVVIVLSGVLSAPRSIADCWPSRPARKFPATACPGRTCTGGCFSRAWP